MDGSFYGKMADDLSKGMADDLSKGIDRIFLVMTIFVPLGIWKVIDIIVWGWGKI